MTPRTTSRQPDFQTSRRSLVKAGALGTAAFTAGLSPAWRNLVVAQATPAQGGEFRSGAAQDAVSMHPFLETDTASFSYIDLHYFLPPLRYAAESMELEPFAADSFTAADDLSSVQFKLREDLLWSDGEPITANDYVWTWEQASNPDNAWPRLGSYEPFIDTIAAADDYTIDVTLKEPIAISLEKANGALTYVLPKHIWEEQAWGDPQANTEIMAPTVSGGPFVLDEWRKDQYATFTANENFFLGRPNFDTYTVQLFGNANIALESLYGGDIHQFGPSAEAWPEVLEQDNLQALQWDAPDNAVMYVGFNCRLDIFSTAPVRQALNYALDKELITQELTYGLGERATGMYLPASWAYNPDVETFAYDPDRAKQILEDDGWVEGSDGVREKDGQRLSFQFIYGPNNDVIREQIATVSQEMWAEVGAEVEVLGMEWGAYLSLTREGPYDWGVFMNMYIPSIDPDIIWFKREAGDSYNRAGYQNEEIFTLYEEGLKEFDREKRAEIYKQIQTILTEESPWIWVFYEQGHDAISTDVEGVEVDALGLNDVWEWSRKQ